MQFEWDREKRLANIRKHHIDFADVTQLFYEPHLVIEDERFDYHEQRYWAIGFFRGNLTIVVYTYVREQAVRIISARRATNYEQKEFLT